MKRRFAYLPDDQYQQIRIDNTCFKGYACYVKLQNIKEPKFVDNGKERFCLIQNDYSIIELYPDGENYALTINFDDRGKLIEWYFDIASEIGTENGIPYEDDLYLDLAIMPNGEAFVLDEDELLQARESGKITQADVDLAYKVLSKLQETYASDLNWLKELTSRLSDLFHLNTEGSIPF